jgi:pimeloyl-ACP methyl ester carboxylesterase
MRIALLPGAGHTPEDFVREGFGEAVGARGLAIDLEFIAPDLKHVLDRSVLESLQREVVAPARAAGCRFLWLGGVSLGGYIALAYAQRRPADLNGLCLLAPYLGNRMITEEIASAGGVQSWYPGTIGDDDEERRIWSFIRGLPVPGITIALGIARRDRFRDGQGLLADALPAETVNVVDGGHEWPVWRQLWELFLDRLATGELLHEGTSGV